MGLNSLFAWDESTVFIVLEQILRRVAPLKVTGAVFLETSLSADLDFDSLDAVDMLAAVNERFSISVDFEKWIEEESSLDGTPFTLASMCRLILEALKEK